MPGQDYDNELRGVLFNEKEKKSEKHPDFTGSITIQGAEYRLSAWRRKSKAGAWFLSLAATAPDDMPAPAQQKKLVQDDDDCPF